MAADIEKLLHSWIIYRNPESLHIFIVITLIDNRKIIRHYLRKENSLLWQLEMRSLLSPFTIDTNIIKDKDRLLIPVKE